MIGERRVTEPQREELYRLAQAPQPCFGKSRALVQRRLVLMGLARFINKDGSAAMPEFADLCEITDAGRAVADRSGVIVARASRVEEEPARPRSPAESFRDPPRFTEDLREARIVALEALLEEATVFEIGKFTVKKYRGDYGKMRWQVLWPLNVHGQHAQAKHDMDRDAALAEARKLAAGEQR